MRIVIASLLPVLDSCVGSDLQSSPYLMIVDLDTMQYRGVVNPMVCNEGPSALEVLIEQLCGQNISVILARECGEITEAILDFGGIRVVAGIDGSVKDAIRQFKEFCLADTLIMPSAAVGA